MKESVKLQCKIDDLVHKEWDNLLMDSTDVVEALIMMISDLVDSMDSKEDLNSVLELFSGVVDDIETKLEDFEEAEEIEEEDDDDSDKVVGPFLCKIHFPKKKESGEKDMGCKCHSK